MSLHVGVTSDVIISHFRADWVVRYLACKGAEPLKFSANNKLILSQPEVLYEKPPEDLCFSLPISYLLAVRSWNSWWNSCW